MSSHKPTLTSAERDRYRGIFSFFSASLLVIAMTACFALV